jgi:antitoxin ParD1/3/4
MKPAGQMSVTLTPELEKLVREEVESGHYASNSEVIRDALRERFKKRKLQELEAAIDIGIADFDAGRSLPVQDAFAQIRKELGVKIKPKRR